MMDAKEFLMICAKECRRGGPCCDCEFVDGFCAFPANTRDDNDEQLEQRVDRAISIAEKLSHVKTFADDFFEKFPNAAKRDDGTPGVCRDQVYGTESANCANMPCRHCWNEPYYEPEEETK